MHGITLEEDGVNDSALISYGIVSFDNIGIGILTIFQVITLEGWTVLMYNVKWLNKIVVDGFQSHSNGSDILLFTGSIWIILPFKFDSGRYYGSL
jgi:hypothetical protein